MNSQPPASPRSKETTVATARSDREKFETGAAGGFLFPPDGDDLIFSVLDLINELASLGIIEVHHRASGAECYRITLPKKGRFGAEKSPRGMLAARVGAIFGRRPTSMWTKDEVKAFKEIKNFDDLELVENFYRSEAKKPESYCRTSVLTLLRHYPGEVDRAKRWQQVSKRKHSY